MILTNMGCGCDATDEIAPPLIRGRGFDPWHGENSVGSTTRRMGPYLMRIRISRAPMQLVSSGRVRTFIKKFKTVVTSSATQWSFSSKTYPQNHHSFKSQENNNNNNKPKIGFESLASAGLVTITTTTEVVDTIHRPYGTQIGAQYSSSRTHHQANLIPTVNLSPAQKTSPISGVVGTTELRGAPRISPGPAQLTIFYAGSVSVYDNISPEKAQAIMLLAGNAPAAPVQTIPNVDKFHGTSPSNFSSLIPISSRGTSQSVGAFNHNNTNESSIIRSIGVLNSSSSTTSLSKIVTSQDSHRPPSHNLSAIPQARRASLARFLEKRKDRVVSASPYGKSKQISQHMTPNGSSNWNFSINSSGSTLLPAAN
ncbi:putative methyltransferase PMT10-like [Capsicum annuum]|nr:putative methyltransferase PMT10-like [Capsicum annuum]